MREWNKSGERRIGEFIDHFISLVFGELGSRVQGVS